jgi:hypothetical protein
MEKTRFLAPRYNQRNRVFAVFVACNASSQKKPGFWAPLRKSD